MDMFTEIMLGDHVVLEYGLSQGCLNVTFGQRQLHKTMSRGTGKFEIFLIYFSSFYIRQI